MDGTESERWENKRARERMRGERQKEGEQFSFPKRREIKWT